MKASVFFLFATLSLSAFAQVQDSDGPGNLLHVYLGQSKQGEVYRIDTKEFNCIKVFKDSSQTKLLDSICAPNTDGPVNDQMAITNPKVADEEERSYGGKLVDYLGARSIVNAGKIDQQQIAHEYPIVIAEDNSTCVRTVAAKSARVMEVTKDAALGYMMVYFLMNPIDTVTLFKRGGDERIFKRVKSICWQ